MRKKSQSKEAQYEAVREMQRQEKPCTRIDEVDYHNPETRSSMTNHNGEDAGKIAPPFGKP